MTIVNRMVLLKIFTLILLFNAIVYNLYSSNLPLPIDSRIKVFIYMPNSIFNMTLIPGYQSVIEFGLDEEISIVAFGDSNGWDIKPIDNKLFIKPTEYGLKTNMQIFTNKNKTYWFEIKSGEPTDVIDDKFAYSVKFFYPDTNIDLPIKKTEKIEINKQAKLSANSDRNQQININKIPQTSDNKSREFNFKYSYAGHGNNMPLKVFDDAKKTYFEFKNKAKIPLIYSVNKSGSQDLVPIEIQGDFVIVHDIKDQFYIKDENNSICIFNNKFLDSIGYQK